MSRGELRHWRPIRTARGTPVAACLAVSLRVRTTSPTPTARARTPGRTSRRTRPPAVRRTSPATASQFARRVPLFCIDHAQLHSYWNDVSSIQSAGSSRTAVTRAERRDRIRIAVARAYELVDPGAYVRIRRLADHGFASGVDIDRSAVQSHRTIIEQRPVTADRPVRHADAAWVDDESPVDESYERHVG